MTADQFTFSLDASNYTSLALLYAVSSDSDPANYSAVSVDISSLDGNATATYQLTTAASASYDNFIITGTVPEPSTYAAIFGALALAIAVVRRRK